LQLAIWQPDFFDNVVILVFDVTLEEIFQRVEALPSTDVFDLLGVVEHQAQFGHQPFGHLFADAALNNRET
jgi:hypothetical protein